MAAPGERWAAIVGDRRAPCAPLPVDGSRPTSGQAETIRAETSRAELCRARSQGSRASDDTECRPGTLGARPARCGSRPLAAGQCTSTVLVGVASYCAHGHTTDEAGESRMSFCGHAAKIIAGAGGRRRLENVGG